MKKIDRVHLKEQMQHNPGLKVVEVLPREEYEKYHIPGALNVPLDDDFEANIRKAIPDRKTDVVVYCANASCQASEKAARKMGRLGYRKVYDYEAGKEDWRQAGMGGVSGRG